MYHPDRPDIIEGSDIIGLVSSEVKRLGERVFAILHVELSPSKDYPEADHQMHVTNGVNPRLLSPSHEDLALPKRHVEEPAVQSASARASVEKRAKE